MTYPQFYDAIASNLHTLPDSASVMAYSDGFYAAIPSQVARFHRVRWITVTGNFETSGAADWLPDNRFDLAAYVSGRKVMNCRARVYVARSAARHALNVLGYPHGGELWTYPGLVWWIPTLDDKMWSPDGLAQSLKDWDAPIPAGSLWANQWTQIPSLGRAATADQSSLFLPW
jgi:hypothetical protein